MEWRVLPHQNDIHIRTKIDPFGLPKAEMRARHALQVIDRMGKGGQPVIGIKRQRADIIMPNIIATRARRRRCAERCC